MRAFMIETRIRKLLEAGIYDDTRTVDLHIQRLRKKLGMEKNIQTVFKVGYRYISEDE